MEIAEQIERIKSKLTTKGTNLEPPLTESEVAEFEQTACISLPAGYREFLLHVGNGGEGPPNDGMLGLGLNSIHDCSPSEIVANLQRPFPFVDVWIWEHDEWAPDEDRYSQTFDGNLSLGEDGCGMNWLLIVDGPQCGQIWNWSPMGIQPCNPGRRFLSWYEYWVDGGNDWYAGLDTDK